jgi:hypothetical protein
MELCHFGARSFVRPSLTRRVMTNPGTIVLLAWQNQKQNFESRASQAERLNLIRTSNWQDTSDETR